VSTSEQNMSTLARNIISDRLACEGTGIVIVIENKQPPAGSPSYPVPNNESSFAVVTSYFVARRDHA